MYKNSWFNNSKYYLNSTINSRLFKASKSLQIKPKPATLALMSGQLRLLAKSHIALLTNVPLDMEMHDILMLIQNQLRGKRFLAKVALILGPDVGMGLAFMADHVSARLEDD